MIEYRKANMSDIDELVRIRIDFLKEAQNVESSSDDLIIKKSLFDYFERTLNNNTFTAWLAIENKRIIGISGLCFYTLLPLYGNLSGGIAYITNVYIEPVYRHRGIATYLFEKTIEEAKSLGYTRLCLHATDKGRQLYKKYAFRDINMEMILDLT